MKYSTSLLGFFLIAFSFISCKSEQEKRVELLTNQYVRLVDSITQKSNDTALANWPSIEHYFEKKTSEINVEVDKLEDNHDYDAKIDSATAKYEAFRNSIILQKLNMEGIEK
jgi:hypothetical protein